MHSTIGKRNSLLGTVVLSALAIINSVGGVQFDGMTHSKGVALVGPGGVDFSSKCLTTYSHGFENSAAGVPFHSVNHSLSDRYLLMGPGGVDFDNMPLTTKLDSFLGNHNKPVVMDLDSVPLATSHQGCFENLQNCGTSLQKQIDNGVQATVHQITDSGVARSLWKIHFTSCAHAIHISRACRGRGYKYLC